MHRHAEAKRDEVKKNRDRPGNDPEFGQRYANNDTTQRRVDYTIEAELLGRNRKLTVDGQYQHGIEFSGADQFGDVGNIDEEKSLKKLRDHLIGANQQDDFPFCPIADAVDISKNDAEKHDLSAKPEHLHHHPEQEVRFETHLANERVPKHDRVNLDVTPEHVSLSF